MPLVEERKAKLVEAWEQACQAIIYAQSLWGKPSNFCPYQKGDQVWLEGMNLRTSHSMHKLCLKQFRLFLITEVLSVVTYHLDLPPSWQIHNAFHASLLSLYHKTREHRTNYSKPTPELIDNEPEWEVE